MTALQQLYLYGNVLSGSLPQAWSPGFPSMFRMGIDRNRLTGMPLPALTSVTAVPAVTQRFANAYKA